MILLEVKFYMLVVVWFHKVGLSSMELFFFFEVAGVLSAIKSRSDATHHIRQHSRPRTAIEHRLSNQ